MSTITIDQAHAIAANLVGRKEYKEIVKEGKDNADEI